MGIYYQKTKRQNLRLKSWKQKENSKFKQSPHWKLQFVLNILLPNVLDTFINIETKNLQYLNNFIF